jgi:hypothetical protein
LGKAAAVSAFGVDEGAVDVEEDEGFHVVLLRLRLFLLKATGW